MYATLQERDEALRAATARAIRSELRKAGEEEHRVATSRCEAPLSEEVYVLPDDAAGAYLPSSLQLGTFVILPTGSVSRENGVPINDTYRVEAAVYNRGIIQVALRWFAVPADVVGTSAVPLRLARTEMWMMSTPEEVASKAASLGEAAAERAKIAGALLAVDYVYALLATRSELQVDGLTFDDEYWSPMQYIAQWIRLVVGQKLDSSMDPIRADNVFQDIRVRIAPLRLTHIARRRTACLDHPEAGLAPSVAADAVATRTRRRHQDGQDREAAAPKRARLSAPPEAAPRSARTPEPAAGDRENEEPNSTQAPAGAKGRETSRIPCAPGGAGGRDDDVQHAGPEPVPAAAQAGAAQAQGAGAAAAAAAAASPEGLTAEKARALGELLAAVPPSSEELDLARSLGELGGTVGPYDRAIALGLIRLASLARETLGDAVFDRLFGALVFLMLRDRKVGSCDCGSGP
eukprot:m51a1_g5070 hypothetical protein (463) ;mRNA; f:147037-148785